MIREIMPHENYFLREMLELSVYFHDESKKVEKLREIEPILSTYFDGFGRRGDLAFVVVHKNELIGAAWTRLFIDKELGNYGYVDENTPEVSMALNENYRGQGIGKRLMIQMLEQLIAQGFQQVSLSVDKRNRAQNLYRSMGFEVFSEDEKAFTMYRALV